MELLGRQVNNINIINRVGHGTCHHHLPTHDYAPTLFAVKHKIEKITIRMKEYNKNFNKSYN